MLPLVVAARVFASVIGSTRVGPQHPGLKLFDRRAIAAEMARFRREPVGLRRPLLILNGYHAPALVVQSAKRAVMAGTGAREEDVLAVSYTLAGRIEDAATAALHQLERRWPSPHPGSTVEVDVVGISMGGLVARWMALPPQVRRHPLRPGGRANPEPALRIARLLTMATPHRGAVMAQLAAPDDAARDMAPGARFLELLDAHPPAYEMICYSQYRDRMVGALNTAPAGCEVLWAQSPLVMAHFTAISNPWIYVDLCRRLRGEAPIFTACSGAGHAPPRH